MGEQKLVKKGDQRNVKKVEQRPSVEKEQNIFNKEKIGNQIEHRVKTVKERDKNDGSEAGIDSDEEVEVHRKKKKTKKQSRENSDHSSPPHSSPKYTESTSTINESRKEKDRCADKSPSPPPSKPQVFANPFFGSSSSSEDEKDKEQLVEMLYSLISDEKQNETDVKTNLKDSGKSEDEDLSSPDSVKKVVNTTVLEELPSKSAFDSLIGQSSDVTVEALEDTLDTSELEATFVADEEPKEIFDENSVKGPKNETTANNILDVSTLKSDLQLLDFITILELECGGDLEDKVEIDLVEIERMVETALLGLESKSLRHEHI